MKLIPIVADRNSDLYLHTDEFTPDGKTLRAFIEKFNANEVEPFVKSEPVPESQGTLRNLFFYRRA